MTDLYGYGRVRIRASVHSDIEFLRDHLRAADVAEIKASHDQTPYEALSHGLRHSTFCATVLYCGEPVAIFGVVPDDKVKNAGVAWMLATNDLYKMRFTFLKLSRRFVKMMQGRYPILYNFIDSRNIVTARWLCWLGASLDDPKPLGVNGENFQYFELGKSLKAVA